MSPAIHFRFLGEAMAEQRIKEELAKLTTVDHVRPNKLRKLVCKEGGVNWTEFQETLDKLIERNEVQTGKQNGEVVILVSANIGDGATSPGMKDDSKQELQKQRKEVTMKIPLAVAQHLTRKGRRKQKNIEQTCKSRLVFSGVDEAKSPRDNVTLQIINEAESEERATKQLKAAKVCIGNMVSSFREHPDRFTVKKAGGTLAEQEKAKKIRERGAKVRAEKHQQKRGSAAKGDDDAAPAKKKKKRKYY